MKFKAYMRPVLAVVFTFFFSALFAQKQRLIVGGYTPGLYIDYKVGPKETFSSIAAIYNIVPDSLSEFNNIDYYEGPLMAKTLKVPLDARNFTQKGIAGDLEILVPVYHMVNYNESIQQISSKANRLPISSLKKWNIIPSTGIVKGMPILIGFLKAKPEKLDRFEDTASAEFARVDRAPAHKPLIAKTEKKVDTASVALNTNPLKKTQIKKEVAKPRVNVKVDSAATVVYTPNKTPKKEVVKLKPLNDSSSVAVIVNKKVETKTETFKPKANPKADSLAVANTVKKSTPKKEILKPQVDSAKVAFNTPNKVETKNTVKPLPETKVDSGAIAVVKQPKEGSQKATIDPTAENKKVIETSAEVVAKTTKPAEKENAGIVRTELNFQGIYSNEIAQKPERQLTGEASYFESKTGWSDKKYYVLIPNIAAGTIVKISSIDNRFVYAKVLGTMPEMQENNGILLRLSNAAVAALGIKNEKFPVVVNFY
jgi:hypothetical protein